MIADKEEPEPPTLRSRPYLPGFLLEELAVLVMFLGLVLLVASILHPSMVFEAGLDETELRRLESPADPFSTPPRILPEWYFLATFELLKLMAPWLVMILITLFTLSFFLVPFIDRFLSRYRGGDLILKLSAVALIVIFIYFTLVGMGLI
jgi:quinol-cytochrome oxidoreductase complex cytochrome b subunit